MLNTDIIRIILKNVIIHWNCYSFKCVIYCHIGYGKGKGKVILAEKIELSDKGGSNGSN